MANNKERIEPTDTIRVLLALRRNKDNRPLDPDHQELCFHQVIRDYDTDLKLLKVRIASYPGIWRIHRTINSRHLQRARIWMLKYLIDTDGSYDYRIETLWKKALMKHPIKENMLIDIDSTDVLIYTKVKNILEDNKINIVKESKSPNGYHIVCPIFDTRLILNIDDVGYKRDGYIFIEEVKVNLEVLCEKQGHDIYETDWGAAVCKKCNKHFGWWCPDRPDKSKPWCEYNWETHGEDCIYCGQPEERK